MDMIIAVIVLAVATTVSFMSFVTLSKQIAVVREESRGHWKSVEDSIDFQRNRISSEIQEGKTFNDNAFIALNENLTACKTEMVQEIKGHDVDFNTYKKQLGKHINDIIEVVAAHDDDSKERYIKVLGHSADSREIISANVDYIVKDYIGKVIAEINKSTRDINFITKQQAGRVITTPLRVMMEQPKVEDER